MKEDFLHFVWLYKKFQLTSLYTTKGKTITILNAGQYLQKAGPDFFNAQLLIDNQRWAGNVEIHLKSSDWYVHHHQNDVNYDNVVLHVVWDHDVDVFRKNNESIPVLELKSYVLPETVAHYEHLMKPKSWINCENELKSIDDFTLKHWFERLFIERLEKKSTEITNLLAETTNNWEHVFYTFLAKSFGLNTNGNSFLKMMQTLPVSLIRKERHDLQQLEALFFGTIGLLNTDYEDVYFQELKEKWLFLQHKYQLEEVDHLTIQFFKHRPDNFPTIRLAQLAQLMHSHENLFQSCLEAKTTEQMYQLFKVQVSPYWLSHYIFDKESPAKKKYISPSFVDLLILNCIIPIKFCYATYQGKESIEELIALASAVQSEKNSIVERFQRSGIKSLDSYHSQALLQLKNEYCNFNRCLNCEIGQKLINFTSSNEKSNGSKFVS
jgi:hypothetical protein